MNSILASTPPMGWNSWNMMFSKTAPILWLFLLFCIQAVSNPALTQTAPAKSFLHPLFSDGMVLQREIAAPVWGRTTPNARVTVAINDQITRATAGADGKWMARVGPFAAGLIRSAFPARKVRYAWADNPVANLKNGAGLPAFPFRTDRP